MPISRTNTMRSKSRSPASSLTPNLSTPRPFLPPAHYAAAGGFPMQSANEKNEFSGAKKGRETKRRTLGTTVPLEQPSSELFSVSAVDAGRPGLPELEAQLLPSLRDTIERMTRVPSTPSTPFDFAESPRRASRNQTHLISPELLRHGKSKDSLIYSPATEASNTYINQANPTLGSSSSRLKAPAKSSLKPSLRAPTPVVPKSSTVPVSPSVAGSSLRTMKSLLSRKYSETMKSPFTGTTRIQKDPREIAKSAPTTTNVLEYPNQYFSTKKNFQSSIPRPRSRHFHDEPGHNHSTEDSDLGKRYEDDLRDRRKLTVANAEVSVSGTSSESDSESLQLANYLCHNPVGLGLSFRHDPAIHTRTRELHNSRSVSHEKTLRFSLPVSESVGSTYSDELDDRFQLNRRNHSPASMDNKPPRPHRLSAEDDSDTDRDEYSIQRIKVRRRSSSCTPASPEQESDGFVPIIPPRSRSACQHRGSRSPPPNLRELIKNRHSSSKLTSSPRHRNKGIASTPVEKYPATWHSNTLSRQFVASEHTEASAIAKGYRSAVASERMAFGIPPSESDEALCWSENDGALSAAGSEMSSINASLWQEPSEDLSEGAESIFKVLKFTSKKEFKDKNISPHQLYDRTPRLSVISPTLSASSAHEHEVNWNPNSYPNEDIGRKPSSDFDSTSQDVPKTREGVIQEIFETEEELLRRFHVCMRTFILPLRVNKSRSWIAGVPANVARLFDWFDDIVNLHEEIYQSLCSARDTMSPATDRVSESLRCFVMKAEVYQPYLVRLADVSEELVRLMNDPKSDFGQFITMQQRSSECEGWFFERLLMLPVNRLAAYQELFARMLDLTPKTHQDYLSTFSLSRSTDVVIRVMTEVKIREDEYNLLKAFASRVQGLSSSKDLATRERRLLHSGPLTLVLEELCTASEVPPSCEQRRLDSSKRASRASKLIDAVNVSSSVFERSDSDISASSFGTSSIPGTGPSATSTPVKSSWFSRLPLRKRTRSKSPLPPQKPFKDKNNVLPLVSASLRTIAVHAFVFSDLVLLAQPSQITGDKPRWILSNELGIFRPLSIARIQCRNQEGTVVSLEALAPNTENLNDNPDFRTSSFRTVDLVLPGALVEDGEDRTNTEILQPWLLAFRECSKTTLRKMTFVGHGDQDDFFIGCDEQLDSRLAVSALVGSGLPIPRSPSGSYPNSYQTGEEVLSGHEREERGWWSLRYQQVFREFRRQDSLLSDDDDAR